MNGHRQNLGFPILAVTLPLAVVASTYLLAETARSVVPSNQIVKVRGVAEREIVSDRVDWTLLIRARANNRDAAFARVDEAADQLRTYLGKAGIPESRLTFAAPEPRRITRRVVLDELGNDRQEFVAIEVSQRMQLKGFDNLDLVAQLEKSVGNDLVRAGWPIQPSPPYYYFSKKVSDIKPALLKDAARNAYERATIVAESSGSSLAGLRAARQGAFEGMGSDGFVGGATRTHRISAVVTVDYALGR